MTEHDHQVEVVRWADGMARMGGSYAPLVLLYAVPNAARRSYRLAAYMRAEGMRSGVPDLHLPVARDPYHGLWIEMKTKCSRASEAQKKWHEDLRREGHRVEICRSATEAREVIAEYMGL